MKLNYGKVLIWSAIIVAVPRWAGAFIAADVAEMPPMVSEFLHWANLIAGIGMGFLEVIASAYLLDAWGKMKPKASHNAKSYNHRWKILTIFVIGLFALMPFILAPYIVARMTDQTIAQALGNYATLNYLWAFAVVLSPAFIVGGVAVANDDLMETKNETKKQQNMKPLMQPQMKQMQPVSTQGKQPIEQMSETRKAVYETTKRNPNATQEEVSELLEKEYGISISRQMVGRHQKALNGELK